MSRTALRRVHLGASMAVLLTVTSFLAATVIAETSGDEAAVESVKFLIARAIVVLVAAMVAVAVSGRRLAGGSRAPVVRRKLRRVQAVAVIGVLVLIPCAVGLDQLAARGQFGNSFAILQGIELVGGAVNLTLLVLNFRDGIALRTRRRGVRSRSLALAKEHHR